MNTTRSLPRPLSVWLFTDNKPGHRNQLEGLLGALAARRPVICTWMPLDKFSRSTAAILKAGYRSQGPDFIFGAGHSTHKYLLLGKLLTGAKSIVLMKPSLPLSWFDLALIPAHDGISKGDNSIITQGVINKIKPSTRQDRTKGLFLIGGPSGHYGWDSPALALQIATLVESQPEVTWQLTTSRRTPAAFIDHLNRLEILLKLTRHTETSGDWLPEQLALSGQVWVTEDSVSMLYEALTSGAQTGLLEIPRLKSGRLQRGIENLLEANRLCRYRDWLETRQMTSAPTPLHEAQRCADLILSYFDRDN